MKLLDVESRSTTKITNSYNDKLKIYFNKKEHNKTYDSFIKAINNKRYVEAEKFLTKNLRKSFNIKKLDDVFNSEKNYNNIVKLDFDNRSAKNSMLIINESKKNDILHMHLTYEPDEHSKWKIFAITRE